MMTQIFGNGAVAERVADRRDERTERAERLEDARDRLEDGQERLAESGLEKGDLAETIAASLEAGEPTGPVVDALESQGVDVDAALAETQARIAERVEALEAAGVELPSEADIVAALESFEPGDLRDTIRTGVQERFEDFSFDGFTGERLEDGLARLSERFADARDETAGDLLDGGFSGLLGEGFDFGA